MCIAIKIKNNHLDLKGRWSWDTTGAFTLRQLELFCDPVHCQTHKQLGLNLIPIHTVQMFIIQKFHEVLFINLSKNMWVSLFYCDSLNADEPCDNYEAFVNMKVL